MAERPTSPWYELAWMALSPDQLKLLSELAQKADATGFVTRAVSHRAVRKVKGRKATAERFPWRILDQLIERGMIMRIKEADRVIGYALTGEGRLVTSLSPLDPRQIDLEAGDAIVDLCRWHDLIALCIRLNHLMEQAEVPLELRLEVDRILALPKQWMRERIEGR